MRQTLTAWVLLAVVCAPVPARAQPGRFLCVSEQPYAYHMVAAPGAPVTPRFRQWLVTRSETGEPGRRVVAERADGFVVFATQSDGRRMVEIHYGGKLLAAFPGILGDADVHSGRDPKLLLLTWDQQTGPDHDVTARQQIIDARGTVLAARDMSVDPMHAEGFRRWRFTADGEGIYRTGAGVILSVGKIETYASNSMDFVWSFALEGSSFEQVYLQTPKSGFAIAWGGQLFRFAKGHAAPVEAGGNLFSAEHIIADPRSGRVLVSGSGGYRVFDWSGRLLFAMDGFDRHIRYVPSVKLAIDGSVGVYDAPQEKYVIRINRGGNYARTVELPLTRDEWGQIACFTPNSAALGTHGPGAPRLVDFRDRR